jgi:hypothetical protein
MIGRSVIVPMALVLGVAIHACALSVSQRHTSGARVRTSVAQ